MAYRWRRNLGFGSTESDSFDFQLNIFKNDLIKLYKKKAAVVALREALRFKYLAGFKTKLGTLHGEMLESTYTDRNAEGEKAISAIISFIKERIPMTAVNGGPKLGGWGEPGYSFARRNYISFLSPTNHLLSDSLYPAGSDDQRPLYKIYPDMFAATSGYMDIDWILDNYFVYGKNSKLSASYIKEDGMFSFDIPPSLSWFKAANVAFGIGNESQYEYVANKLSKNYPSGNLKAIVNEMQNLLVDIINQTGLVISIQKTIDKLEFELAEFVETYKSYFGASFSLSEFLLELQNQADKADVVPTTVQVPSAEPFVQLPAPAKQGSKWPWAAAAVGIYLTLRK